MFKHIYIVFKQSEYYKWTQPSFPMTPIKIGPFTIIPLELDSARSLATGQHGLEEVPKGQKTQPHTHPFVSFYVALSLTLLCGSEHHVIPENALVIVPEGVDHSWISAKDAGGYVGSIDTRHEEQVLISA